MTLLKSFTQGSTNITVSGEIEFLPTANAYGWDTCDYVITDIDLLSDTATFTLLINKQPLVLEDTFLVTSKQEGDKWIKPWATYEEFVKSDETLVGRLIFHTSLVAKNELSLF